MLNGRLPKSFNFRKVRVNFGKKSNGTPGEYNLGLIIVPLSSNQNPVILLSVL